MAAPSRSVAHWNLSNVLCAWIGARYAKSEILSWHLRFEPPLNYWIQNVGEGLRMDEMCWGGFFPKQ
jgi:hypothetical protein